MNRDLGRGSSYGGTDTDTRTDPRGKEVRGIERIPSGWGKRLRPPLPRVTPKALTNLELVVDRCPRDDHRGGNPGGGHDGFRGVRERVIRGDVI
jgi:hypothetical protein